MNLIGILLSCLSWLAWSDLSWAILPPINLSPGQTSVNCDDFCKQFGPHEAPSGGKQPTSVGIFSSNTWNSSDDQTCCAMAGPNSQYQTTSSCPFPSPDPSPAFTGACQNPSFPNMIIPNSVYNQMNHQIDQGSSTSTSTWKTQTSDPNGICQAAGNILNRCLYHNSQVETQCMAYNLLTGAVGGVSGDYNSAANWDIALATVDLTVSFSCFMAAAFPANLAWTSACTAGATAEGVAELAVTLSLHDKMAPVFQEYQSLGGSNPAVLTLAGNSSDPSLSAPLGGVGALAGAGGGAATVLARKKADESTQARNARRSGYLATAAIYATLGGIRTTAAVNMNQAKQNACKNIQSLFSNSENTSGSGSGSDGSGGSVGGNAGGYGSGGVSGGGRGAGGNLSSISQATLDAIGICASQTPSSSTLDERRKAVNNCYAQQGLRPPSSGGATAADQNLLTSGNLGDLLKNAPSLNAIANHALQNGAGSALAAALPGDAGALGASLANIAKTSQENASELASALGVGSIAPYTGGTGGGTEGGGQSAPLFNPAFGFGSGAKGGAEVASFGDAPKGVDIWHSNSNKNIFEIISEKITKVSSRVQ